MKDRINLFVVVIGLFLALGTAKVSAHEGSFILKNASAACEGISVWRSDRYQITGRCAGLVYPYSERQTNYVLWVKNGDQPTHRVANIDLGLFTGSADDVFTQIFVSVESSSSPRQPSDLIIASGYIQPFVFKTDTTVTNTVQSLVPSALATPTPTLVPAVVASTPSISHQTTLTLAVLIGVILAIFAAIFIVRRGH